MSPRWIKVVRDLSLNKARTLLALIALCVGTFSVGSILSAYAVLTREIATNFNGTHPASVVLHMDAAGADEALAREVRALPGVSRAEARGMIEARALFGPDEWRRILLYVVEDFDHLQVSTFARERGQWPPATGEILIERSAVPFLQRTVGDALVVQTPGGPSLSLRVTGIVHDPGQSPGWVDGLGYGYITRDTLARWGQGRALNELRIVVDRGASAADVGQRARRMFEASGHPVAFVNARQAAEHPHATQMSSLLFLFGAFGALSLVLGGLLAASVVSTLLRAQVRQIGAMKAIGATSAQIARLFAGAVLLIATAALAVGVPAGALGGLGYARFVSDTLNFNLTRRAIPAWVFALQLAAGLAVPLLAAAVPVLRGSAITVRQAITDYGIDARAVRVGFWSALPARIPWLGRPTVLSLRNTFRRKGRLLLTLGILAVGGATFMSALNVSASWSNTVDNLFTARRYDLQVIFARPYPTARIEAAVASVPGVRRVETWSGAWAYRREPGDPTEGYRLMITGVPPATEMVRFPLLEGRWLRPNDTHAIVINHELRQDAEARMHLGDVLTLHLNGRPLSWRVVGVVRELGVRRRGQNIPAAAYVNGAFLAEVTGVRGVASNLVLTADARGDAPLRALTGRIERALDAAGLQRTVVQPSTHRKKELLDHLVVIRSFLLAMAALVALVGGLALASAMSVNVMERTREIGVFGAIGATTGAVVRIFVVEGLTLSLLGWLAALGLSLPMSVAIGDFAGRIFVHSDLDGTVSLLAVAAWLGLALLIGLVASALPALSAARIPLAKALHYE